MQHMHPTDMMKTKYITRLIPLIAIIMLHSCTLETKTFTVFNHDHAPASQAHIIIHPQYNQPLYSKLSSESLATCDTEGKAQYTVIKQTNWRAMAYSADMLEVSEPYKDVCRTTTKLQLHRLPDPKIHRKHTLRAYYSNMKSYLDEHRSLPRYKELKDTLINACAHYLVKYYALDSNSAKLHARIWVNDPDIVYLYDFEEEVFQPY